MGKAATATGRAGMGWLGGGKEGRRTGGSGSRFAAVGEVWCWWRHPTGAEGAKEGTRAFICIDRTRGCQWTRPPSPVLRPGKSIQSKMETLGSAASSQPTAGQRFSVGQCQVPSWACLNNQTTRGTPTSCFLLGIERNPMPTCICAVRPLAPMIRRCLRRHGFWATSAECAARPSAPAVHDPSAAALSINRAMDQPPSQKSLTGLVAVPHHQ